MTPGRPSLPVSARAGFPARHRTRPRWLARRAAPLAVLLIALGAAATYAIDTSTGGSSAQANVAASESQSFLRQYVEPSGRVVRPEQGGTTVSEGQAYGMLVAESVGRPATVRRIWRWTAQHLQQPDGELAYLTDASGRVVSTTPAADADVLATWALSRYRGPGAARLHAVARRMSRAILSNETVRREKSLLLAAGPWATGSPASLDPSYWSPLAFSALAHFTGDIRWSQLAGSARRAIGQLTAGGRRLPPDWARMDGTRLSPTAAPNRSAPQVQYSLDAQRVVVWLAASCRAADRRLAARWWDILSASPQRETALSLQTDGAVIQSQSNPLAPVAAAAAAGAAGDMRARGRLLAVARRQQQDHPTYYGGAWLALGETLLETGQLGGCGPQGGI